MTLKEARLLTELAIRKAMDGFNLETDEIEIYAWSDPPLNEMKRNKVVGFRVAEVSFTRRGREGDGFITAGSSYMQSDTPHGLAVCAATERAVIGFVEEWEPQYQHEEVWRLVYLISEDDETAARVADEIVPDGIPERV